ncbi:hypothetical protein pb186bvf_018729 [Paramecium bursaria]
MGESILIVNSFRSEFPSLQSPTLKQLSNSVNISHHQDKIKRNYIIKQMNKLNYSVHDIEKRIAAIDPLLQQNEMLSQISQTMLIDDLQKHANLPKVTRVPEFNIQMLNTSNKICQICIQRIDEQAVLRCDHLLCVSCLDSYIKNKILNGQVQSIKCPAGCGTEFTDQEILTSIGEEYYHKYKKFKRIKEYEKYTNGKWCPKAECDQFVFRVGKQQILECKCGQNFCFSCGNPEHGKLTCEQALDQSFQQAVNEYSIHRCPKCNYYIQKNYGCNHMTCWHCNYEFCWLCGRQYRTNHYDFWNIIGCPGSQDNNRDPYTYPTLLLILSIILKLILYLILAPFFIFVVIIALMYHGFRAICSCCGRCLNQCQI